MFKKVKQALTKAPATATSSLLNPRVITRGEHGISREDISDNALKVLYRLNKAGYQAYLVGGCVRDLMLGLHPKDFDVATNATPEQIKAEFKNCRLIGRRFRLAHIMFGREIIEVATFRGHHNEANDETKQSKQDVHGQLLRDNVFGSLEEDAERRDFTFNAMYYSVADFTVTDFANGVDAINKREVALIGDAEQRYREDPVRMLRAVRFAAKLNMQIVPATAEPILQHHSLLSNIPAARLFEETLKLFLAGQAVKTFELLQHYKLFAVLFPQVAPLLTDPNGKEAQFINRVLENTDNRINNGLRVTPAFLYAALLWYPLEEHAQQLITEAGLNAHDAFNIAVNEVLNRQIQRIMIPKRFTNVIRDIWVLQQRLPRRFGRRAYTLLTHPKFRAGYDFLLLRGEVEGGDLLQLAQWWGEFQEAEPNVQKRMITALRRQEGGGTSHKPRRRRRRPPINQGNKHE